MCGTRNVQNEISRNVTQCVENEMCGTKCYEMLHNVMKRHIIIFTMYLIGMHAKYALCEFILCIFGN